MTPAIPTNRRHLAVALRVQARSAVVAAPADDGGESVTIIRQALERTS